MVILVPEPYTQNRKAYIFCTWKFDLGNDPILHMTLFPWGLSGSAIIFYIDGDSDDWFKYIKKNGLSYNLFEYISMTSHGLRDW